MKLLSGFRTLLDYLFRSEVARTTDFVVRGLCVVDIGIDLAPRRTADRKSGSLRYTLRVDRGLV